MRTKLYSVWIISTFSSLVSGHDATGLTHTSLLSPTDALITTMANDAPNNTLAIEFIRQCVQDAINQNSKEALYDFADTNAPLTIYERALEKINKLKPTKGNTTQARREFMKLWNLAVFGLEFHLYLHGDAVNLFFIDLSDALKNAVKRIEGKKILWHVPESAKSALRNYQAGKSKGLDDLVRNPAAYYSKVFTQLRKATARERLALEMTAFHGLYLGSPKEVDDFIKRNKASATSLYAQIGKLTGYAPAPMSTLPEHATSEQVTLAAALGSMTAEILLCRLVKNELLIGNVEIAAHFLKRMRKTRGCAEYLRTIHELAGELIARDHIASAMSLLDSAHKDYLSGKLHLIKLIYWASKDIALMKHKLASIRGSVIAHPTKNQSEHAGFSEFFVDTNYWNALVYYKYGEYQKALDLLDLVIKNFPTEMENLDHKVLRAKIYNKMGSFSKMDELINQVFIVGAEGKELIPIQRISTLVSAVRLYASAKARKTKHSTDKAIRLAEDVIYTIDMVIAGSLQLKRDDYQNFGPSITYARLYNNKAIALNCIYDLKHHHEYDAMPLVTQNLLNMISLAPTLTFPLSPRTLARFELLASKILHTSDKKRSDEYLWHAESISRYKSSRLSVKRRLETNDTTIINLGNELSNYIEFLHEKHPFNRNEIRKAYRLLGKVYYRNNQIENSIHALQKAVELNCTHSAYELAKIYRQRGDDSAQEKYLLLASNKGVSEAAFDLGIFLEEKQEFDAAIQALMRAEALGHSEAALQLAELYRRNGQFELARKCYRRAVGKGVANAESFYSNFLEEQDSEKNDQERVYFESQIEDDGELDPQSIDEGPALPPSTVAQPEEEILVKHHELTPSPTLDGSPSNDKWKRINARWTAKKRAKSLATFAKKETRKRNYGDVEVIITRSALKSVNDFNRAKIQRFISSLAEGDYHRGSFELLTGSLSGLCSMRLTKGERFVFRLPEGKKPSGISVIQIYAASEHYENINVDEKLEPMDWGE